MPNGNKSFAVQRVCVLLAYLSLNGKVTPKKTHRLYRFGIQPVRFLESVKEWLE